MDTIVLSYKGQRVLVRKPETLELAISRAISCFSPPLQSDTPPSLVSLHFHHPVLKADVAIGWDAWDTVIAGGSGGEELKVVVKDGGEHDEDEDDEVVFRERERGGDLAGMNQQDEEEEEDEEIMRRRQQVPIPVPSSGRTSRRSTTRRRKGVSPGGGASIRNNRKGKWKGKGKARDDDDDFSLSSFDSVSSFDAYHRDVPPTHIVEQAIATDSDDDGLSDAGAGQGDARSIRRRGSIVSSSEGGESGMEGDGEGRRSKRSIRPNSGRRSRSGRSRERDWDRDVERIVRGKNGKVALRVKTKRLPSLSATHIESFSSSPVSDPLSQTAVHRANSRARRPSATASLVSKPSKGSLRNRLGSELITSSAPTTPIHMTDTPIIFPAPQIDPDDQELRLPLPENPRSHRHGTRRGRHESPTLSQARSAPSLQGTDVKQQRSQPDLKGEPSISPVVMTGSPKPTFSSSSPLLKKSSSSLSSQLPPVGPSAAPTSRHHRQQSSSSSSGHLPSPLDQRVPLLFPRSEPSPAQSDPSPLPLISPSISTPGVGNQANGSNAYFPLPPSTSPVINSSPLGLSAGGIMIPGAMKMDPDDREYSSSQSSELSFDMARKKRRVVHRESGSKAGRAMGASPLNQAVEIEPEGDNAKDDKDDDSPISIARRPSQVRFAEIAEVIRDQEQEEEELVTTADETDDNPTPQASFARSKPSDPSTPKKLSSQHHGHGQSIRESRSDKRQHHAGGNAETGSSARARQSAHHFEFASFGRHNHWTELDYGSRHRPLPDPPSILKAAHPPMPRRFSDNEIPTIGNANQPEPSPPTSVEDRAQTLRNTLWDGPVGTGSGNWSDWRHYNPQGFVMPSNPNALIMVPSHEHQGHFVPATWDSHQHAPQWPQPQSFPSTTTNTSAPSEDKGPEKPQSSTKTRKSKSSRSLNLDLVSMSPSPVTIGSPARPFASLDNRSNGGSQIGAGSKPDKPVPIFSPSSAPSGLSRTSVFSPFGLSSPLAKNSPPTSISKLLAATTVVHPPSSPSDHSSTSSTFINPRSSPYSPPGISEFGMLSSYHAFPSPSDSNSRNSLPGSVGSRRASLDSGIGMGSTWRGGIDSDASEGSLRKKPAGHTIQEEKNEGPQEQKLKRRNNSDSGVSSMEENLQQPSPRRPSQWWVNTEYENLPPAVRGLPIPPVGRPGSPMPQRGDIETLDTSLFSKSHSGRPSSALESQSIRNRDDQPRAHRRRASHSSYHSLESKPSKPNISLAVSGPFDWARTSTPLD